MCLCLRVGRVVHVAGASGDQNRDSAVLNPWVPGVGVTGTVNRDLELNSTPLEEWQALSTAELSLTPSIPISKECSLRGPLKPIACDGYI